jgi:DNA-binding NarL/FixJ family response regulator
MTTTIPKMQLALESKLTPRQQELIGLILHGKTCAEAAESMGIAEKTANVHLWSAYRQLGVHSKMELANLVYGLPQRHGARKYICPTCKRPIAIHPNMRRQALTPRQEQVRKLLSSGLTHRQIAVSLKLSTYTVKAHVNAIRSLQRTR